MNGIRFHSWCPPEAAFAAADEMGFYLQPEWMWVPFNVGSVYSQMLEEETARMFKAFGNHPSFFLLSPGNEPGGHELAVLPQWAQRWHERDPRRLYSGGANGPNPPGDAGGAQYLVLAYNGKKNISTDLSQLKAPGAYRLVVGLEGTTVLNDWNFWVYPALGEGAVPGDVLITSDWSEAEARLAQGGKVLFTVNHNDLDPARSPEMRSLPVYWDIQMSCHPPKNPLPKFDGFLRLLCDTKHPALAEFPTDTYCDWQWTPLVNGVKAINLSTAPPELTPVVSAIDDYDRNWRLGAIFECKVGSGRLVVSAIPFDQSPTPGALQLSRSLLDYMGGKSFNPPVAMSPEPLKSLFQHKGAPAPTPERRVFDPDLNL